MAPTLLNNTTRQLTDLKIDPRSTTEGEISAILNQKKVALILDTAKVATEAEPNDVGDAVERQAEGNRG